MSFWDFEKGGKKAKNWRNEESSASFIIYRMLSNKTGATAAAAAVTVVECPKNAKAQARCNFGRKRQRTLSQILSHTLLKTCPSVVHYFSLGSTNSFL